MELKSYVNTKTCTQIFTAAALFIITPQWKQSKYPPMDEGINKMWSLQTMEHYSAIKMWSSDTCYNTDEPWKHCLLSWFSHVWFFVTPSTAACQAPLFMGFFRQEYWSGFPCPPPGHLSDPGIKPQSPMSPALAGGFFTMSATWGATENIKVKKETRHKRSHIIWWSFF